MSLLTFLPRLTAWGSTQRGRPLQPILTEERNLKEDIFNHHIDITRSKRKKKKQKKVRRKRISYWSDEEVVSIKPSRLECL